MAKTTVEIPDQKMAELEAYKDRLGELLLLGVVSGQNPGSPVALPARACINWQEQQNSPDLTDQEMVHQARVVGIQPRWSETQVQEELA